MPNDFWSRIRQLYRNVVYPDYRQVRTRTPTPTIPSAQPVVPAPTAPPEGPMDMASKISMLADAGRRRVMVRMKYDGQVRLVEPYSFRDKGTGRLFYGWCSIHSRIHSFKPERIETVELTDISYMPRWEVEL